MLVFGVEEDPLGVGVDIGAGRDEQRCDVSLPPLDGDIQRRLACGQGGWGGGAQRASETLVTPRLASFPPSTELWLSKRPVWSWCRQLGTQFPWDAVLLLVPQQHSLATTQEGALQDQGRGSAPRPRS